MPFAFLIDPTLLCLKTVSFHKMELRLYKAIPSNYVRFIRLKIKDELTWDDFEDHHET